MEYEVRITLQAQAHLREIRDYIAQKLLAPEAAKSTVQRCLMSEMCPVVVQTAAIYAAIAQEFRAEYPAIPMHRTFNLWFWR